MNKEQADRLATLYYFLKNNITDEQYYHFTILTDGVLPTNLVRFNAWDIIDAVCCSLGWCTVVFPEHFDFTKFGSNDVIIHYNKSGWFRHENVMDFFGLNVVETDKLFNTPCVRSRKDQLKLIKTTMNQYGWTV